MKLLLLKILLKRRARDEGFVLPIVIALGLIMALLSAVHVIQSGEENLISISQNSSADALALAEAGITEYRELINRNRILAVHNSDNWSTIDDSAAQPQVCDSDVSTKGNTNTWHTINNGTDDIGEYRLVSYLYDNDGDLATDENGQLDLTSDANNNARGILTVQGRTNDGSIAQVQVQIPIGINTSNPANGVIGDLDNLVPALWVQQSDISDRVGNLTIDGDNDGNPDGNIVLYRPSGSGGCDDPADLAGNNTISDPRTLPPITTITALRDAADAANQENPLPSTIDSDMRLADGTANFYPDPLPPGDPGCTKPDTECRYYYINGSNVTITDADILTDGKVKVILYIDGNLNITGTVNIVNSSDFTLSAFDTNTPANFLGNLKPNWTTTAASSRFLEIHVTGNVTINGTNADTINIKGLIYAPNGTVSITGNPTVNIVGSVWANDWNNSGTVTIIPDDFRFYNLTTERTPKPLTFAPDEWEKQEVVN